jgi:hypothetical protein
MVVVPNNKSSSSSSTSSPQRQNNHSFPVPRSRTEGTTTTHLLPSTAPVSSLLPAIPTTASHHHAALVMTPATIQAQLAALLTQGAVTQQQQQQHASTATPSTSSLSFPHQPQTHLHHHTHSSPAQLLAAAAHASAATAAVATNPLLTAAAVNMHHWSLEQLGTFSLAYIWGQLFVCVFFGAKAAHRLSLLHYRESCQDTASVETECTAKRDNVVAGSTETSRKETRQARGESKVGLYESSAQKGAGSRNDGP